jgi:comEA protein
VSGEREKVVTDWTSRPAKWAAVLFLGAVAGSGVGWSVWRGGTVVVPGRVVEERGNRAGVGDSGGGKGEQARAGGELGEGAAGGEGLGRGIDVNTAGQAELELLPGIGPALARRIIEDREANGAFERVEDLDRVSGIGPKTVERLRGLVRVGP